MSSPNHHAPSRQESGLPHYQTFPTQPPKGRGKPPSREDERNEPETIGPSTTNRSESKEKSPLPYQQLLVLAIVALAEQTALNSLSPYLPNMASTFPEVDEEKVALYVGSIASAFASAQFATNFFWGWLSDRIGRKPVILCGTLLTAACFVAFGFCRTLWQAIIVQALMGLVNGNQGVVSTCLGEITDRSNQGRAFTYLPVVYGIGGITGPIVGGLLVDKPHIKGYPFLPPNLLSAAVLGLELLIIMFFLEESLDEAKNLPPLGTRMGNLFTWLWEFTTSHKPPHSRPDSSDSRQNAHNENADDEDSDVSSRHSSQKIFPHLEHSHLRAKDVLTRDTVLILASFLIFQFSNVAYNSLYPVFAEQSPPMGRDLSTSEVGVSLAFAGLITIVFQVLIFGRFRDKIGNRITYRIALGGFVVSFLLMPWVGYKDPSQANGGPPSSRENIRTDKIILWAELGVVLIIKTVASVGGLTSALLLVTNSAPDHTVLGTLNGLAQTLSAAGRAIGPLLSGAIFSLSTRVRPKGEALAFGVFGAVAFIGFLMSFGIRAAKLEDAEGEADEENSSAMEDSQTLATEDESSGERTSLLTSKR